MLLIVARRTAEFIATETYGAPPTDPRASPLLAPNHAGLPPTYVQVMEQDPCRDDGLVYERVLREVGVKTRLVRYASGPYGLCGQWN